MQFQVLKITKLVILLLAFFLFVEVRAEEGIVKECGNEDPPSYTDIAYMTERQVLEPLESMISGSFVLEHRSGDDCISTVGAQQSKYSNESPEEWCNRMYLAYSFEGRFNSVKDELKSLLNTFNKLEKTALKHTQARTRQNFIENYNLARKKIEYISGNYDKFVEQYK
jgi:hypothetical protein